MGVRHGRHDRIALFVVKVAQRVNGLVGLHASEQVCCVLDGRITQVLFDLFGFHLFEYVGRTLRVEQ
jgi:hypothetical protein